MRWLPLKAAVFLSVMSCLSLWWDSGTLFRHFLSFSDFHNMFSSFLYNIAHKYLIPNRPSVLTAVFVFQILCNYLLRSQAQDGPHLNSVCLVQMSTHSLFFFLLKRSRHTFRPPKCQLNSPEPVCLPPRPSDSGASLHGDASGPGETCGDDLPGAESPPIARAAVRVAAVKPAAPRRSLRRPERWDGVHHPQPESRRLGGVHL